MFELRLNYAYLENHRQKVGIQGSWEAYFELFKSALKSVDVSVEDEGNKSLDLYYPLMQGARIKDTFVLDQESEIRGMLRHQKIQTMLRNMVKNQFSQTHGLAGGVQSGNVVK